MSVFNNLGRRASELGSKAIEHTRNYKDIVRFHNEIAEEERNIENIYLRIGKRYAAVNPDSEDEGLLLLLTDLKNAETKVAEKRTQIQILKGIRFCESCGEEIERGALFCSSCGAPVPQNAEEEISEPAVCKHCGAPVKDGNRFCTICGQPVQNGDGWNNVTSEKRIRTCIWCGKPIEADFRFCVFCGGMLMEAPETAVKKDTSQGEENSIENPAVL